MLENDPGVQSRRKAEAEWLKNNPQAQPKQEAPGDQPPSTNSGG
jgi:hypothetical protein